MTPPTLGDVLAITTSIQALKPAWLFEIMADEQKIPFVSAEHPASWTKVTFRWTPNQWSCVGEGGEPLARFGDLRAVMLWGLRLALKGQA